MLRVGLDITSLIYDRGVSRYTANLVRALVQRKGLKLSLFGSSFRQKQTLISKTQQILKEVPTFTSHSIEVQSWPPSMLNWVWKFGQNRISTILPKIEVFHSWDWLQPPDKKLPLVSTIHDLAMLKYPDTAHPQILNMHQQSWKVLRERGAEIIAISQATKRDIIEFLEIPGFKIHVIPEALPVEMAMVSNRLSEEKYEQIKQRLQLNRPFLLFVGTREPRKNLLRLIKAWYPLKKDIDLIIAGEAGWDKTKATQDPQLRFLGKVSDEELVVLYGEAKLFCYPSLYEGFGLPILEAFVQGTPVLTSNLPALIEVAGNAAQLVDPESDESIRDGILKVLNESTIEQQQRLQRMIIRLQMFSWDRVAEQTIDVYKKAIERQS